MTRRDQFEDWYKERHYKAYMARNSGPDGTYMSYEVQRAWEIWCESRETLWPWQAFADSKPENGQHVWIRPEGSPTAIHNLHYNPEVQWLPEDEWMPAPDILDIQALCEV